MRLFAAVELPAAIRASLAAWAREAALEQVRLVAEESLHVTLVFLGSRPDEDAERIGGLVTSCAAGPVELELGEALWLAPRRPHVLTVALRDPSGALASLQGRVAAALRDGAEHEPEARPFRPHVTVGRVRRGERVRPDRVALPPVPEASFAAPAVALWSSRPGQGGSRYEEVSRAALQ